MTWHVLRTRWGSELDVARALGYETICPKRLVVRRRGRYRRLAERAVYESYLLVRAPLADDAGTWHEVAGTAGVVEIMGGEFPKPVSDAEVARLRSRVDTDGYMVDVDVAALLARWRRGFGVGDRVRVIRGKWRGFEGDVEEIIRDVVVSIKTALFRREVTLYALVDNCEVVEDSAGAPRDNPFVKRRDQHRGGRRGTARRLRGKGELSLV